MFKVFIRYAEVGRKNLDTLWSIINLGFSSGMDVFE